MHTVVEQGHVSFCQGWKHIPGPSCLSSSFESAMFFSGCPEFAPLVLAAFTPGEVPRDLTTVITLQVRVISSPVLGIRLQSHSCCFPALSGASSLRAWPRVLPST